MQRPSKKIIDTIEYNLEQLNDLTIDELDLLKETVDTLIIHVERLKEKQQKKKKNTKDSVWCDMNGISRFYSDHRGKMNLKLIPKQVFLEKNHPDLISHKDPLICECFNLLEVLPFLEPITNVFR